MKQKKEPDCDFGDAQFHSVVPGSMHAQCQFLRMMSYLCVVPAISLLAVDFAAISADGLVCQNMFSSIFQMS